VALTLHLVRHGRASDVDGRCIGHTDRPLSDAGRVECDALATSEGWRALPCVSSDLLRAQQTAAILTTATITTTPLLREMHFGEWEDRTWSELEAQDGARLQQWMDAWVDVRAPGGESFTDVIVRTATWLQQLQHDSDDVLLVVAHAGAIRALAVTLLGLPAAKAFALRVDHARVSSFSLTPYGASLLQWNAGTL
jgi:broad specificity phosphatase PhoE